MKRFARHVDKLILLALALATLALYLRTLAPDVVDADGGQFQFAAWHFGFVHPTGYPLFLMLGGAFQHLVPIGNPAYRLNVFTALTAALAVAALYLAAKALTRARGAAIIAALSFALTRTFWYDAGAAEVYALHAFLIALLLYIALRWQAAPSARTFAAFCLACGLALTHHRAILLWLPAFAVFFLVASRRFKFHVSRITVHFALFVLCFLLPLVLYLYIPLRAPASPYYTLALAPERDLILYDNTLEGFINYVLGRTFQSEIRWDATSVARLLAFPQRLLEQFGVFGVALGAFGALVMAWQRDWARAILLALGFGVTILFASLYHIGDFAHYYIPAYLGWAIWIGVAVAWTVPHVSRVILPPAFYLLLSVVLMVPQFVIHFPFADRSRETWHRAQWTRILSAPIPPDAILISNDRDEMMPLWYLQYVEQARRDVLGLFPRLTPEYPNIARVTDVALATTRPVFFIKPMPGIEIKYRVTAFDGVWRVNRRDEVPRVSSDAVLADRVRVIGYDVLREAHRLRVAIYWQPTTRLAANYTTFVHLLDANGNKVAQGNDHQVGGEFYPTSLWDVGETLRDEFAIPLPPHVAIGEDRLLIGMYRSSDGEMLGEPVELPMANDVE